MNLQTLSLRNWRYIYYRLGFRAFRRELLFYHIVVADHTMICENELVEFKTVSREFCATNEVIGWLNKKETLHLLDKTGFVLCGAFAGGRLIGNCWLELESCDLEFLDLYTKLPEDVCYVSRVYVAPDSRGMRVSEGLIRFALAEAARRGKKEATICCVPSNSAMRHILPRSGWRHTMSLIYLRFIAFRLYRFVAVDGSSDGWTTDCRRAGDRIFGNAGLK